MSLRKTKILIIEDDIPWSVFIESIFEGNNCFELLDTMVTLNHIEEIIDKNQPDLLLCDVRVGNSSVFTLFEDDRYCDIPKIFMTNHLDSDTYNTACLVSKSIFLAKPFHKFTLLSSIDLLLKHYPINIPVTNDDGYLKVRDLHFNIINLNYEEIAFIKAEGNYSIIHVLGNKKFVRKKSLSQISIDLDEQFIQIQKAFIINKAHIKKINLRSKTILVDNTLIPIGRKFYPEIITHLES
jgi:DNA-binding LytR/AlgR family response regulator